MKSYVFQTHFELSRNVDGFGRNYNNNNRRFSGRRNGGLNPVAETTHLIITTPQLHPEEEDEPETMKPEVAPGSGLENDKIEANETQFELPISSEIDAQSKILLGMQPCVGT